MIRKPRSLEEAKAKPGIVRVDKTITRWKIVAAINIFLSAFFLAIALVVALIPTINKFGLFKPTILIAVAAACLSMVLIYVSQSRGPSRSSPLFYNVACVGLFVLSFATTLTFGYALASTGYTWDSELILRGAAEYAANPVNGVPILNYLEINSNNTALFLLLTALFKFAATLNVDRFGFVIVFNAIALLTAQVLTFLCAKMLYGRRIGLISIILSSVLIGCSLFVHIPYTDTLSIVFPILIVYISLHLHKAKSNVVTAILSLLMGLTTVLGTLMKPTVIIALIGIALTAALVCLLHANKQNIKRVWSRAVIMVVGVASSAFIGYSVFSVTVDTSNIFPYPYVQSSQYAIPFTHFMNIGLHSTEVGYSVNYGGFDSRTVKEMLAYPTRDERSAYSVNGVKKQLEQYGPVGYIAFLSKKLVWITSDGTFFAFGEGDNLKVRYLHTDQFSSRLRQLITPEGRYYLAFGNAMQVVWLSIWLLIGIQFIQSITRRSTRRNVYLLCLRLIIFGILSFLLLFEGRSRYLFLYVPIFILLSLYALSWFGDQKIDDENVNDEQQRKRKIA